MGWLTTAAIATTAASGVNAVGQVKQGRARKRAAMSEAERLEMNAQLAESQSADAIERGREAKLRHQRDTQQLIGAQRTAYAGQGVLVDEGSALETVATTAGLSELDVMTIEV